MKSTYTEYYVECDKCGVNLRDYDDIMVLNSAKIRQEEMKRLGWIVKKGIDYCENCRKGVNK